MQCPHCGAAVRDNLYQCPICSTILRTVPALDATQATVPVPSGNTQQATPLAPGCNRSYAPPPGYSPPYPHQTLAQPAWPGSVPASAPITAPQVRTEAARSTVSTGAVVALMLTLFAIAAGIVWYVQSSTKPIYPLTNKMRLLETGDTFTYRVTMEVKLPPEMDLLGRGGAQHVTGMYRSGIVSASLDNRPVLAEVTQTSLDERFFSRFGRTYIYQDPTTRETVTLADRHGADNSIRHVVQREGSEIGIYNSREIAEHRYVFDNGDTEQETERVTGIETVETPRGKFTAWRVESAGSMTMSALSDPLGRLLGLDQPMTIQTTEWIVPQLGTAVQRDDVITGSLFAYIKVHMLLDSTSVPLK